MDREIPSPPYLFLICQELLLDIIRFNIKSSLLRPIKVTLQSLSILHLFYVDDSIFFLEASQSNSISFRYINNNFDTKSGLIINNSKPIFLTSSNVDSRLIGVLDQQLQIKWALNVGKYLGAYFINGKDGRPLMDFILERARNLTNGCWYFTCLIVYPYIADNPF